MKILNNKENAVRRAFNIIMTGDKDRYYKLVDFFNKNSSFPHLDLLLLLGIIDPILDKFLLTNNIERKVLTDYCNSVDNKEYAEKIDKIFDKLIILANILIEFRKDIETEFK